LLLLLCKNHSYTKPLLPSPSLPPLHPQFSTTLPTLVLYCYFPAATNDDTFRAQHFRQSVGQAIFRPQLSSIACRSHFEVSPRGKVHRWLEKPPDESSFPPASRAPSHTEREAVSRADANPGGEGGVLSAHERDSEPDAGAQRRDRGLRVDGEVVRTSWEGEPSKQEGPKRGAQVGPCVLTVGDRKAFYVAQPGEGQVGETSKDWVS